VTVGADRTCDLVVDDPALSRQHAELTATPEGVRVRDLGSTNGTFWQSSRVMDVMVPAGASVRLGGTTMRFLAGEAPRLPPSPRRRFGGMVGDGATMRELFSVLEMASPTDATVLLEGESGTGKELAARAIHDHSARAAGPMVIVDCGAIGETLIDSHLFGHVRGSFTGALADRKGAFVEASGGTIFLDEIGELPLAVQARLLRVLEAQTVQPVGSDKAVQIDARIIAATHRNLAQMVERKEFRFDLFYRLAVVHAVIPPLRERMEDVPALVRYFYEGRGIDPGPIGGENLARMERHGWPGNGRELRNVLERAWALSGPGGAPFERLMLSLDSGAAPPMAAGEVIDTTLPFKEAKERWTEEFERRYLAAVFAAHRGNITHAADHAGINRRHFRTLLRKHGIIATDDEQ
jgi:DNA-binding NtrC family response regulator